MLLPEFSADQIRLLNVIYAGLGEDGKWPTTAHVDSILAHDYGLNIDVVLAGMPDRVVWAAGGYSANSVIQMNLFGMRCIEQAAQDLENYVALIRYAAAIK